MKGIVTQLQSKHSAVCLLKRRMISAKLEILLLKIYDRRFGDSALRVADHCHHWQCTTGWMFNTQILLPCVTKSSTRTGGCTAHVLAGLLLARNEVN